MRYWKKVNSQGATTTVESYSHDQIVAGLLEITESEFRAYVASLPDILRVDPQRLAIEKATSIEELKAALLIRP